MGLLLSATVPAHAQGFAIRGGVNVNPDQFYGGGQYAFGPVVDRVWFQPNTDIGWGNGATLVTMNFDVTYRKPLQRNGIWTGYVGGGPAINWYRLDVYSTTDMGVSVVAGLIHSNGVFTDFKVGFHDSPQFRVAIGYAFRPETKTKPRVPRRR
jgi:hypothetical protein